VSNKLRPAAAPATHRGCTPAALPSTCTSGKASCARRGGEESRQSHSLWRHTRLQGICQRDEQVNGPLVKLHQHLGPRVSAPPPSARRQRVRVVAPCSDGPCATASSGPRPKGSRPGAPASAAARRTWCARRRRGRRRALGPAWDAAQGTTRGPGRRGGA
jgi:hypothetical protein